MSEHIGQSPAEKAAIALELHKIQVVRIQDELDALVKIFSHMRESLQNEMFEGLGYKKAGVLPSLLKPAESLTKMMTSMVDAKIRFDKAAKVMADQMTPEEERAACMKYVKSLPVEERNAWVRELKIWLGKHNESYDTLPAR